MVKDGESWARARTAFAILLSQWGNAAYLASSYVGGQSSPATTRGDKGDARPDRRRSRRRSSARPLKAFVTEQVLSDKAFQFSPALLRKLAGERWYHWGNESLFSRAAGSTTRSIERVLAIQKIVLSQCLDRRHAVAAPEPGAPGRPGHRAAEDGRGLPDPDRRHLVGTGRPAADGEGQGPGRPARRSAATSSASTCGGSARWSSASRREPLRRPVRLHLLLRRAAVPADARSLARLHLKEIGEPDRQGPRPEGRARSTTRPAPTSRSAGTGSTRSSTRGSTPTNPDDRKAASRPTDPERNRPGLHRVKAGPNLQGVRRNFIHSQIIVFR